MTQKMMMIDDVTGKQTAIEISLEKSLIMIGSLSARTGTAKWYPARAVTLQSAYCSVGITSGYTIVVDIKKNGISLLTSNPITVPANALKTCVKIIPDVKES